MNYATYPIVSFTLNMDEFFTNATDNKTFQNYEYIGFLDLANHLSGFKISNSEKKYLNPDFNEKF